MTPKPRAAEQAIASLASVFGNPLRVRIISALSGGPKGAAQLQRELEDESGSAHYHLDVLQKQSVVELFQTRPVRGVAEHVFRLRPRATWGKLWEAIPLPLLPSWRGIMLRQFVEVAAGALDAGGLDDRVDTTFTAGAIVLDRKGVGDVNEAFKEVLKMVDRIERASRRRLVRNPDGEIPTVVAAAVFEAPSTPGQVRCPE